ncbi:MAG: hypothetical protein CSA62_13435 [Planctomycetota bacterium]|nr:MAG: hypothetical protein CSA62_13435 [Planctomycetota bacterium]
MTSQPFCATALTGPLALVSLLTLSATSLAAPKAQESESKILALVLEAQNLPLNRAWAVLPRIEDLEMSEDRLLKGLEKAAASAKSQGKLIVARSMLNLDEEGAYSRKAVGLLAPLLSGQKEPLRLRIAAASMLGDPGLRLRAGREASAALSEIVAEDTAEPDLRLAAASSLYRNGRRAADKTLARKTLNAFLLSSDRQLRINGALALAEIDDIFSARAILEEIENEPTEQGRLARSYLNIERKNREMQLLQKQVNRILMRTSGASPKGAKKDKLAVLRELIRMIEAAHIEGSEVDEHHLIELAAKGMMRGLDRFSAFLSSDDYREFAFDLNRDYGGIGAYVNIGKDGIFRISRPIYSGPAYKAGLLSGDRVLKIDGWETTKQDLGEIIKRLKGKPDTAVKINVWRPGWQKGKDMVLKRAQIQIPSVNSTMLPGKVGYVELVTFARRTAEEVKEAVLELKQQGAKTLVMDLRNNGGGYLSQARGVAELFLPEGKLIVSTKSRVDDEERLYSRKGRQVFTHEPLIILVNGNTASASEIVSGALQDHKRALIVGTQSYGKGSVQNLLSLRSEPGEPFIDGNGDRRWNAGERFTDTDKDGKYDPGPRARITIAHYFLPSGRLLHRRIDKKGKIINPDYGVIPDVVVKAETLDPAELWKNALIADLWTERTLHQYVEEHYAGHEKLFLELAESDGGKTDRYPDFEAFYKGLKTTLSKDDVRRWLRIAVREKVQDLRHKAWPGGRLIGDIQEDLQLQVAVRKALEKVGVDPLSIERYQQVLKDWKPEKKKAKK